MQRNGDYRGRSMSGSYTYACKYPTQNEYFEIYGIFKRKKCIVNISKMGKYEIYIPKS